MIDLKKIINKNNPAFNTKDFAALFPIDEKLQIGATCDGVGTKVLLSARAGIFDHIGIDLVAMNVNDLYCKGLKPLFFLDYVAHNPFLSKDKMRKIMESIVKGCEIAGVTLLGGETASMSQLFHRGHEDQEFDNSKYDLAGFAVGAAEYDPLPRKVEYNDVILGLPSNGVHANGFTVIRNTIHLNDINIKDEAPFNPDHTIAESLLQPTTIYKDLPSIFHVKGLKGIAHITGGGITHNLSRLIPRELCAELYLSKIKLPKVFKWIAGNIHKDNIKGNASIDDFLLKTFNCGIGAIIICSEKAEKEITKLLNDQTTLIGRVYHKCDRNKNQDVFYRKDMILGNWI